MLTRHHEEADAVNTHNRREGVVAQEVYQGTKCGILPVRASGLQEFLAFPWSNNAFLHWDSEDPLPDLSIERTNRNTVVL